MNLPSAITTVDEAKAHLRFLFEQGLDYHCEDDASDCLAGLVTSKQAAQLNKLMDDIYNLPCNKGKQGNDLGFCPCGYMLDLLKGRKRFELVGTTKRGTRIYIKGNAKLLVYSTGKKIYFSDITNDYARCMERDSKGLRKF